MYACLKARQRKGESWIQGSIYVVTELNNQGNQREWTQKPGFHHKRHLNETVRNMPSGRYSGRKEKSESIHFSLRTHRYWAESKRCKNKREQDTPPLPPIPPALILFMDENLCKSELSNRTRATCHIHLGQVVPSGKTIKDSEKPLPASQVAWGKDHCDKEETCFRVRMS